MGNVTFHTQACKKFRSQESAVPSEDLYQLST